MTAKTKSPAPPTRLSIGRRLRAAREAAGLTQSELAQRLDTLQGAIAQYERGDRTPGAILLWRWSQALGVSLDSLVGP